MTNSTASNFGARYLTPNLQIIITICYVLGIFGNSLALVFLCKKGTRPSNPKHRMMLTCLSTNDLTAMLGMLVLMHMQLYSPVQVTKNVWFCRARVIWRVFGLGSGCVTMVMAVERWLALTKPFLYQKHVTVMLLRRCIFGLWILAVLLVCMPFVGLGLYYQHSKQECARYRAADSPTDKAYAYLYFTVGMLLCSCIVFCNVAVMRSLRLKRFYANINQTDRCRQPVSRLNKPELMRRMSRNCSKLSTNSTRDEMAFARLMGFLCIIFLVCWMPQLLTIPLVQMDPSRSGCSLFYRIADILMALHYLFDPYVYVIQRLPTIRRLLSSTRSHQNTFKSSIGISSADPSYLSKV